jgi:NAD(P)H dehydrogenase (quinone)
MRVMDVLLVVCLAACAAHGQERVNVLVVYHSVKGHTEALARAVEQGARSVPDTEVQLRVPAKVSCQELLATDALVVGSPVYWSNMSAEVKAFFDRFTNECRIVPPQYQLKDKVGAAFTTGGGVASGKELTLLGILGAMLGNRMIVLSEGQALGATATTGEGEKPLAQTDLEEGRQLGERVARVAHALKRGSKGPKSD